MPCYTPVIFFIFRRPDLTAKVFEAIRKAQPTKLFVIADGPRNEKEAVLCQQVREVTEQVDWGCEVFRNYSGTHLGCRKRISTGITWAFEKVKDAIILEDDCFPHSDFFPYCSELLERYRNDTRIFSICGSNFQEGIKRGEGDYYFSRYADPWGWATWSRAWEFYDDTMSNWPLFQESEKINNIFETTPEQDYWINIFETLYSSNFPDSWFYRWQLSIWMNSGLSIWPNVRLISNLGFGEDGTNCKIPGKLSNMELHAGRISKLNPPAFIMPEKQADNHLFLFRHNGALLIEKRKYGKFYDWLLRYRRFRSSPLRFIASNLGKILK